MRRPGRGAMNTFRSIIALGLLAVMVLPQTTVAQSPSEAPSMAVTVPSAPIVATEPAGPQPASPHAAGPQSAGTAPPTSLSVPVTLPQPFEVTISSIAALATGAGAALKTNRSDARTRAIRLALSQSLLSALSAKKPITSIRLGTKSGALEDPNKNESLSDEVMLCGKRQDFIAGSVYLNYLNSLVQNINAVSVKAAAPTDIPSALKLLLATTNYSISDKVKIDAATLKDLVSKVKTNCESDLSNYA